MLFVIVNDGIGNFGSLRREGIGCNASGESWRPKDEEEMNVRVVVPMTMLRPMKEMSLQGME